MTVLSFGATGFEPATPRPPVWCASQAALRPVQTYMIAHPPPKQNSPENFLPPISLPPIQAKHLGHTKILRIGTRAALEPLGSFQQRS